LKPALSRLANAWALRAVVLSALVASAAACGQRPNADPADPQQVARGKAVYAARCASCHGVNLEGQPNWRERLPNGRSPAPPHDDGGHTWQHSVGLILDII
jgi:mono/diheme cytochrome c family protein